MEILIIALILTILFLCSFVLFVIRAKARTRADHIIFGRQPSTEERINRCISILTWTNKQLTIDTDQDTLRLIQLRKMLDEMQNPHG